MKALRIFLVSLVIVLCHTADPITPPGYNKDICPVPQETGGKDFPTIPGDFNSKLEWTDYKQRTTYFVQEFVSDKNNIGTMFVTGYMAPGITSQFITSANTGEYFIIYDTESQEFETGNCVVQPLSNHEEFAMPFAQDPKTPGADKLLSGRSLLNLGGKQTGKMFYNGTAVANGIPCDVWIGCIFVPGAQSTTIKVTYYFSRNDTEFQWFTAGGYSSAPVKIHGVGGTKDNPNEVEQVFNYVYFSTQWPTNDPQGFAKIFETPDHAYCPGRADVFPLPSVPNHFSFRMEVIDHIANTIMVTREWYDFDANYTRMDFKETPSGNQTYDANISPKTMVNDFNTGVSYVMDKFTGECVALAILPEEYDSVADWHSKHVRLRTPKEFFSFDKTDKYPYQYMGSHQVREVACDSWIAYRPYPNDDAKTNASWEWYFSTRDTIIKAGDYAEVVEPMKASIKSPEQGVDLTYEFYRFKEQEPDPHTFDVSLCYKDAGSRSFEMQLMGNWSTYDAEDHLDLLRYWFRLSVEAFAGVRSIRVQDLEFEFYGKRVVARFTILGPAPVQGDTATVQEQVSLDVATDRLTESFSDETFAVVFMPDPLSSTVFSAIKDTLRVITRKDRPGAYRPTGDDLPPSKRVMGPGLNSGQAAGLAIGMIALGALLSAAGIFVFRRLTQPATQSYAKQKLTLEDGE